MGARPGNPVHNEGRANPGSDGYVGHGPEPAAGADASLRAGGGPYVLLDSHHAEFGPFLEVTGKPGDDDLRGNQSVEVDKFRHAHADRRAFAQAQRRLETWQDRDELAAQAARTACRPSRADLPERGVSV